MSNIKVANIVAVIALAHVGTSFSEVWPCVVDAWRNHAWCSDVKVRAAAFIPQSRLFRDIYGKVGGTVDVEIATKVLEHVDVWANIDGFFKHGRSIGLCSHTTIGMTHISLGFKLPYELEARCTLPGNLETRWTLYAGAGVSFAAVWLRNKSPFTWERINKGSVGAVIKSGAYCFVSDCVFLDFFADYFIQPTHFKPRHVNTGGTKVGLGVGTTF